MKYRLERGDDWVELVRFDRVVTVTHADGRSVDHGAFDAAAAEEQFGVLLDQFYEQGFVESAQTTKQREDALEAKARSAASRARNEATASAADPRVALRAAAAEWFADADAAEVEALLQFVTRIDDADEVGFRVHLSTGGAIIWTRGHETALDALWLYPDAEAVEDDDHAVFFGVGDAAPPETPEEVGDVDWFLQTYSPNEKYWFTREQAPWVAHSWEHDGGLKEDGRSPQQVLVSVLLAVLRKQ